MTATTTTRDPETQAAITVHAAANSLTIGSDPYRGALEPGSLGEAFQLAQTMSDVGYCGVTSPADALGRIMTGRSLGLSAMQSLRGLYSVKGRVGIDASLMHALCLASPLCERFDFLPDESDLTKATFIAKRRGADAVKHTFTIEDAYALGVVTRGGENEKDNNWNKSRRAMLRARARSELARIVFPDIIFGMYSREELEDGRRDPNELTGEVVPAAAPSEPKINAAARDYQAEANDLIAIARAAKSKADGAAFRAKFEAWDGIDPFRAQVAEAYNEAKKAARAAVAPVATSAGSLSPVPEGNLFAGAGKDSEQP